MERGNFIRITDGALKSYVEAIAILAVKRDVEEALKLATAAELMLDVVEEVAGDDVLYKTLMRACFTTYKESIDAYMLFYVGYRENLPADEGSAAVRLDAKLRRFEDVYKALMHGEAA